MAAYVNITKHVVNWANVDMLISILTKIMERQLYLKGPGQSLYW